MLFVELIGRGPWGSAPFRVKSHPCSTHLLPCMSPAGCCPCSEGQRILTCTELPCFCFSWSCLRYIHRNVEMCQIQFPHVSPLLSTSTQLCKELNGNRNCQSLPKHLRTVNCSGWKAEWLALICVWLRLIAALQKASGLLAMLADASACHCRRQNCIVQGCYGRKFTATLTCWVALVASCRQYCNQPGYSTGGAV